MTPVEGVELDGALAVVTGGAGFIGSHIVDALVAAGARVRVLDSLVRGHRGNLASALASERVELVEGDIRDLAGVRAAVDGADVVFHQAALWLLECEADPRAALDINVVGTFNVAQAAAEAGVRKLVSASSSSVYGEARRLPTAEDHPFDHRIFYGATKVAGEELVKAFHAKHGLPYVVLRPLNVYGPRQDYRSAYVSVIPLFVRKVLAGETPIIFGDGSETLDLVYVEDVARANLLAATSPAIGAYNVATGRETSLTQLAETILQVMGSDARPRYEERPGKLVSRRRGGTERAARDLGFTAQVTPEEGLRRLIEWVRQDSSRERAGAS